MTAMFGPTFGAEIVSAGLGMLPISWQAASGAINGRENLTPEQNAALDAVIAAHDANSVPAPVLSMLSPRQIRLMMRQVGLSDGDIEAAIDSIPDPDAREDAHIEWRWAAEYRRDHPLVAQLAALLDFSDTELDALWTYAADL